MNIKGKYITNNTLTGTKTISCVVYIVSIAVVSFVVPQASNAQLFRIGAGLEGGGDNAANLGDVAWRDYDNDGDLDLITTGYSRNTKIYKYENKSFNIIRDDISGYSRGSVEWIDLDDDSYLDFVLVGDSVRVFSGNSDGSFTEVQSLEGYSSAETDVGDFDDDGDEDLVIAGSNSSGNVTHIYENKGGTLQRANLSLPGFNKGDVDFGDFEGDGDLDIIVCGFNNNGNPDTKILRNSDGVFSNISSNIKSVLGSCKWGDFDQDGNIDVAVTYEQYGSGDITIYEGDGQFFSEYTTVNLDLGAGVRGADIEWADYESDGDLDIAFPGGGIVRYEDGNFSVAQPSFTRSDDSGASTEWGDFDGDGDLDIVSMGDQFTRVYANRRLTDGTNESPSFNTHPPNNKTLAGANGSVYIEAGDFDGHETTLSFSNEAEISNANLSTSGEGTGVLTFSPDKSQSGGTYSFTIEAEDTEGATKTLEFDIEVSGLFAIHSRLQGVREGDADWIDMNKDGLYDVTISGFSNSNVGAHVNYINENGDKFSKSRSLNDYQKSRISIANIDSDSNIDILISGSPTFEGKTSDIYLGDGSGGVSSISNNISGFSHGSTTLGESRIVDIDNDGDRDVFIAGFSSSCGNVDTCSKIYTNNGGEFEQYNTSYINQRYESIHFFDYDDDGDKDLLVTGFDSNYNTSTILYENRINKAEGLSEVSHVLPDHYKGTISKVDYNSDGLTDIFMIGEEGLGGSPYSKLFINTGGGFNELSLPGVPALTNASSDWGDFDGDGDPDLVIAGNSTLSVFENTSGGLNELKEGLPGFSDGTVHWADFDNDDDLDLLVTGDSENDNDGRTTLVIENLAPTTNSAPAQPSNLNAEVLNAASGVVRFAWDESSDSETPDEGISYHLYLQDGPSSYPRSPHAQISGSQEGNRLLASPGRTKDTSLVLRDLDDGPLYSFGVQAVDQGYKGSEFAEASFDGAKLAPEAASKQTDVYGGTTFDFGDTGVDIRVAGSGCCTLGDITVEKFTGEPLDQRGIAESNVGEFSFVIEATFDPNSGNKIRIDESTINGLSAPSEITAYSRSKVGKGQFTSLPTSYDTDANEIVVETDSFSEFVLASDSNPLPVELASFEGAIDQERVNLSWQTTSETNNAGFEVERKIPNETNSGWQKIGYREGNGTTSESQTYQFTDEEIPYTADSLNYRLRQVDTDGTSQITDPITVVRSGPKNLELMGTAPNPARQRTVVRYSVPSSVDGKVHLQLYDVMGRQVRTLSTKREKGRHKQIIDVSDLSSGVYFLRLSADGNTHTQKLTVVR